MNSKAQLTVDIIAKVAERKMTIANAAKLNEDTLGFPDPQAVSIDVISTYHKTVSITAMLKCLDQALYEAKDDGRNNVKIADIGQYSTLLS